MASRVQEIAGTARGRQAKTQQDLVKIAMGPSGMKDAVLEHPMCGVGFVEYVDGEPVRMRHTIFRQAVATIFKTYPTARIWDLFPTDAPYSEMVIMDHASEGFRMTMDEKAELLAEEFRARPMMAGFRMELNNVGSATGEAASGGPPSLSVSVYELEIDPEGFLTPITIRCRYRPNF